MLIEYAQVKDEQKARIGFRGNLLYATVCADEGRVLWLRRGRLSEVTDSPEIRHLEQAGRYDDFAVHPDGVCWPPRAAPSSYACGTGTDSVVLTEAGVRSGQGVRESADVRGGPRRACADPFHAFGSTPAGAAAAPTSSAG